MLREFHEWEKVVARHRDQGVETGDGPVVQIERRRPGSLLPGDVHTGRSCGRRASEPRCGSYLLLNIPTGPHTITVQRIGYRLVTQDVVGTAGETSVLNFRITEEALQLDEIIVTGTAGGTQRRVTKRAAILMR